MKIVLCEDEIRKVLQKHILEKFQVVDFLVINEFTSVLDEDSEDVEFARLEYVLELEAKKLKEAAS